MLKLNADLFLNFGLQLQDLSGALYIIETADSPEDEHEFSADEKKDFERFLKNLQIVCAQVGLTTSETLIDGARRDLPQTSRELGMIIKAVRAELRNRLFVFIPAYRAVYFDKEVGWKTSFPSAASEMRSAHKCFVAGEATACVFHLMRALEFGLHALARDIGAKFEKPIETQQWHTIINRIESELKKKRDLPGTSSADPQIRFWSDAAAHFFAVKEAYRNHTMHVRVTYDEDQAQKIMDAVTDYIAHLAPTLNEFSGLGLGDALAAAASGEQPA